MYKAGAVIETWRILYWHVGIVSDRCVDGEQLVLSCSGAQNKVVEESMSKFSQGFPIRRKDILHTLNTEEILNRARSQLGRSYDFLSWNCEHFVSYALGHAPTSPQLALATVAVIGWLFKRKN